MSTYNEPTHSFDCQNSRGNSLQRFECHEQDVLDFDALPSIFPFGVIVTKDSNANFSRPLFNLIDRLNELSISYWLFDGSADRSATSHRAARTGGDEFINFGCSLHGGVVPVALNNPCKLDKGVVVVCVDALAVASNPAYHDQTDVYNFIMGDGCGMASQFFYFESDPSIFHTDIGKQALQRSTARIHITSTLKENHLRSAK